MRRVIRRIGDIETALVVQDGKHYRHMRQELQPAIDRTREMTEYVNEVPRRNNRYDREYIGSLPATVLMDWMTKNKVRPDQYARNEGGVMDKFRKEFLQNRDFAKFRASTYKKTRGILLPRSLRGEK